MIKKRNATKSSGYVLVTLLVFMATAMIITSAAVVVSVINTQAVTKYSLAEEVYELAEGGAENAVLNLIRNPAYTGEVMTTATSTTTVVVTGGTTKTITSEAVAYGTRRRIQVIGSFANTVFTVTSWNEVD